MTWVRQLVRFTETHPIYVPDERSAKLDLVGGESAQRGVRKVVFPSLRPNRREDAHLLRHWLSEMLTHLRDIIPTPPAGALAKVLLYWDRARVALFNSVQHYNSMLLMGPVKETRLRMLLF